MKKLTNNKILQIGLTAFLVIVTCIFFSFCLLNIKHIASFIGKIIYILRPLIYGLVLAYVMHPMVNFFENKAFNKMKNEILKRNLSILCGFILILGIIITLFSIVIPQLLQSIQSVIVNAPVYFKDLGDLITSWLKNSDLKTIFLDNYDTISTFVTKSLNDVVLPLANNALSNLSVGIIGVLSFVFNFAIGLVFAVYILANTKVFGAGIRKMMYSLFNVEKVNGFIDEVKHVNHVFGQFMIGKICDSFLFVMTCTFLFLIIFDYPYPLLIAVIIGLTDLIPYFGPYIGSIPSALLICLVNPVKALTFLLFIVVLQQIDGNLITPRIQKQATGLPSFWVLFAITFFGGLFGVVGLLIGVPCFTIIYEIITEYVDKRLKVKNLPTSVDYYMDIDGLSQKVVKSKNKRKA